MYTEKYTSHIHSTLYQLQSMLIGVHCTNCMALGRFIGIDDSGLWFKHFGNMNQRLQRIALDEKYIAPKAPPTVLSFMCCKVINVHRIFPYFLERFPCHSDNHAVLHRRCGRGRIGVAHGGARRGKLCTERNEFCI